MKQKIIEALVTKFGIDAKMVEGIAEKLSKTVTTEEELATAIEGVTFLQILESYADKRANEASETARKNAIRKYEAQYGLKDGKPKDPEPPKDDPKPDPDPAPEPPKPNNPPKSNLPEEVAEALRKLTEQNTKLTEQVQSLSGKIAGFEAKDLATMRRNKLNAAISKLTEAQRKPYTRISLDGMSEADFDSFLEEVTTDAAAMAEDNEKQAKALEAASKRPTVGSIPVSDGKASKSELDAVMKGIH
jgi:hypothetical protein